jgi:lysophospholipase L1-like esterase
MVTLGPGMGFSRSRRKKTNATPFAPTHAPGLLAWYDASDSSSITHASNVISQWNDKSGNGHHVSQGGATTLRPTYVPASNKISFDGGDYLYNTSPFMYASGGLGIYAVLSLPAQNGSAWIGEGSSSSTNPVYQPCSVKSGSVNSDAASYIRNDSGAVFTYNTAGNGGAFFDGTKKIIRLADSGTTLTAHVNGTQATYIVDYVRTGALTLNRFAIGCLLRNTASLFTTGDIYEIVICANDAYGAEVEGYLAHKHGLSSALPAWHPYKNGAPKSNDAPPSIPVISGSVRAALMGDSISSYGNSSSAFFEAHENAGYFTAYNALSGARMQLPLTNNKGIAGNQTSQMVSRLASDLGALPFDTCFVMGGINDINSEVSISAIISNLSAIVNYITGTLDKRCVLLTILSRSTWPGGWNSTQISTAKTKIKTINAWIMAQHGTRRGKVVSVDVYTNFTNVSDEAIVNMTADGVHPVPYGAMRIGKDIQTRLSSYYGAGNLGFSSNNLLSNGLLSGTGGSAGANTTGTVASSFTASGSGGTGGRTASKNGDGSQRLEMVVTGGTSTDTMRLVQAISAGFTTGDTVYGAALVEISGTPVNIMRGALDVILSGTGIPSKNTVRGFDDSGYVVAETYMTAGTYLITTPDLAISSGTSLSLEWRYEMVGNSSSSPSSGIVNILGAGIFKR